MRSIGSSGNSSHPWIRTSLRRGLSILSNSATQWAYWFSLSVRPMTSTSYSSTAWRMVEPQPQPMSSSVIPGSRFSLSSASLRLAYWASSSVLAPSSQ